MSLIPHHGKGLAGTSCSICKDTAIVAKEKGVDQAHGCLLVNVVNLVLNKNVIKLKVLLSWAMKHVHFWFLFLVKFVLDRVLDYNEIVFYFKSAVVLFLLFFTKQRSDSNCYQNVDLLIMIFIRFVLHYKSWLRILFQNLFN